MSANQINVQLYDGSAWEDADNYVMSIGTMPQIFNNRDGSLLAPTLSVSFSKGLEAVSSSTVSIYERFQKIRVYNYAGTRLFFEADFEYLSYDDDKLEYQTQWTHEIARLRKIVWRRDDYNDMLTPAGDVGVWWKVGTPTQEAYITPQQLFRKLFPAIVEKTVALNDFKTPAELQFYNFKNFQDCSIDRGHLFAAGQEIAGKDVGNGYNYSYNNANRVTAFDIISDICKFHKINITYDRSADGNYKLFIPAGFDLANFGTNENLNNLSDNYKWSKKTKRADYTRSINFAYTRPERISGAITDVISYETYSDPAIEATSDTYDLPICRTDFGILIADKNLNYVNSDLKITNGTKVALNSTFTYISTGVNPVALGACKRRYGQKVIEEVILTDLLDSDIGLAIKHDIKVNKGIAFSEITQERRQYNELIKNGELTSNSGGDCVIYTDSYSQDNGYLARSKNGYWISHNYEEYSYDAWIAVDLLTAKNVSRVMFAVYDSSPVSFGIHIEYSNNNSTWFEPAKTYTESNRYIPEYGDSTKQHLVFVFSVDEEITARYWRIRFGFGTGSTFAKIKRIQFYERIL